MSDNLLPVFVVGLQNANGWELVGIASSSGEAESQCTTVNMFVWPIKMNDFSMSNKITGSYYPKRQVLQIIQAS